MLFSLKICHEQHKMKGSAESFREDLFNSQLNSLFSKAVIATGYFFSLHMLFTSCKISEKECGLYVRIPGLELLFQPLLVL